MLQEFVEQVENVARSVMEEIHTAIPGKITSFNPGTGQAVVKPCGTFITGAGKRIAYPAVTGVPVIIPQCPSMNIQIAFPINVGDDCLVIISEQELDAWLGGGESENNMKFDLTSAVAIPGLSCKSSDALKEACASGSVIVSNESTKLSVLKDGVEIKGNLSVEGDISCTGSYPG